MNADDCPNCSYKDSIGGKLIEFEDTDGQIYFRCKRCHTIYELIEKESEENE